MLKPPIEEILIVTPEIEQILGKTADQIRRMTIRQLADVAFELAVHQLEKLGTKSGRITIPMMVHSHELPFKIAFGIVDCSCDY